MLDLHTQATFHIVLRNLAAGYFIVCAFMDGGTDTGAAKMCCTFGPVLPFLSFNE